MQKKKNDHKEMSFPAADGVEPEPAGGLHRPVMNSTKYLSALLVEFIIVYVAAVICRQIFIKERKY